MCLTFEMEPYVGQSWQHRWHCRVHHRWHPSVLVVGPPATVCTRTSHTCLPCTCTGVNIGSQKSGKSLMKKQKTLSSIQLSLVLMFLTCCLKNFSFMVNARVRKCELTWDQKNKMALCATNRLILLWIFYYKKRKLYTNIWKIGTKKKKQYFPTEDGNIDTDVVGKEGESSTHLYVYKIRLPSALHKQRNMQLT